MEDDRSFAGPVLGLVGGFVMLLWGAFVLYLWSQGAQAAAAAGLSAPGLNVIAYVGVAGIVSALFGMAFAILLGLNPAVHHLFGVLMILTPIVNLLVDLAVGAGFAGLGEGVEIAFLLMVLGGTCGIVFGEDEFAELDDLPRPWPRLSARGEAPMPPRPPTPEPDAKGRTFRACPGCRAVIPVRSTACPACGAPIDPVA
jgi:hypothetical protein